MGTSTSSKGPKSKVPLTPPKDDTAVESSTQSNEWPEVPHFDQDAKDFEIRPESPIDNVPLASARRFLTTRKRLGEFGETGNAQKMKNGIASYVAKGYKNPQIAAQRMKKTAVLAAKLFGLLVGEHLDDSKIGLKVSDLEGKSAEKCIEAIVEAVSPLDGTLDSEAAQDSINKVLSELVDQNPDVDLSNLGIDSCVTVVEKFVSNSVFSRIRLDIGQHVLDRASSPAEGLSRLGEIEEYVEESIQQAFSSATSLTSTTSLEKVSSIVSEVIEDTFEIFQSYTE